MFRSAVKVAAIDIGAVTSLILILDDLAARLSYAHARMPGSTFGPLLKWFTMTRSGVSLTSPPTLDWVQVLVLILVSVNAWYAYHVLRNRENDKTLGAMEVQP